MSPELATAPVAREAWQRREREIFEEVFLPQPHMPPSEWAEAERVLSQGPERGRRWRNETTPYLVEIMDFVGAPWARRGVVRKSARVGYTEGVVHNAVGWTVAMDPCPIAIVQPTDGEAESYSKEQVSPFIELNPALSSRIGAMGVRSSDSTITYKEFAGGFLSIMGSASDKNLRRRSFRRVFVDEVDGMKVDGHEGDPLLRLQKRTDDFEDGVQVVGSTPTTKHLSRIDREFERSDQRFYHVPCPHCFELQVLEWGGPEKAHGIKWDKEIYCRGCGAEVEEGAGQCPACEAEAEGDRTEIPVRVVHRPETAYYVCYHCGEAIDEAEKPAMVRAGRWIATNPGAPMPGWHIDALVSLFPGARWGKLVAEFLEAIQDQGDLQVWWNTVLGRAWEERGEKVEVSKLEDRAEQYVDADGQLVEVPDGVGLLTAFVDVQGSWLELLVRGWGLGEESWDVFHERVAGDPEAAGTWQRLEGLLTKGYRHAGGRELRIMCALIDAGYATDTVYGFTKPRAGRMVFASLGDRTGSPSHIPLKGPSKNNAQKAPVYTIGTYRTKAKLFRQLAIERPGPRYMHLRGYNAALCNGFDAEYFAQFDAEKRVVRRTKGSRDMKAMFVQTRERNEAIDLHVGNMAALAVLGAGVRENMAAWVEAARRPPEEKAEGEKPSRRKGRGGSKWATGWKP